MTDQYNFSEPESRIMKVSDGFTNVTMELFPAIASVPGEPGRIAHAVADTGYFSAENMVKSIEMGIDPLIAVKRRRKIPIWKST